MDNFYRSVSWFTECSKKCVFTDILPPIPRKIICKINSKLSTKYVHKCTVKGSEARRDIHKDARSNLSIKVTVPRLPTHLWTAYIYVWCVTEIRVRVSKTCMCILYFIHIMNIQGTTSCSIDVFGYKILHNASNINLFHIHTCYSIIHSIYFYHSNPSRQSWNEKEWKSSGSRIISLA